MTENSPVPTSRDELLQDVGKKLTETRLFKRLSQEDVANHLKLSKMQVHALESGDWSQLPDEVYGLGFLRQYANMIHLDITESVELLKSNFDLTKPATIADPAVAPGLKWVAAALLLFVVLFILFNIYGTQDELIEPTTSSSLDSGNGEMNSLAEEAKKKIASISTVATKAEVETPAIVRSPPKKTVTPAANETPPELPATAKVMKNTYHVSLKANGSEVWLRLSSKDITTGKRKKIKEALLKSGQSLELDTTHQRLLLTSGNASALSIHVDGLLTHPAGSIGQDGKIVRKFVLNISGSE